MKSIYFLSLAAFSLSQLSLGYAQDSSASSQDSYRYAWGDFSTLNSTPTTNGFQMTNGGTIDENGHIRLENQTVQFSFEKTPVRPSLAQNKAFTLAITLEQPSTSFTSSGFGNIFSGIFHDQDNKHLNMDISYNGSQSANLSLGETSQSGQITTKIDPRNDLTIFINQSKDDELSITFYSDRTHVSTIHLGSLKDYGNDLESFIIGDPNSSMTIKGLGLIVGDSIDEEWAKQYFDTVGISNNIPEPGSALMGLAGITALLLRRKRN